MRPRLRLPRRRRFVQPAALFALLVHLGATVGVPLPGAPAKDRSRPFPCMDRRCGCYSAGECRESCCCFSDEEKLAWARRHHVDPETLLGGDSPAAAPGGALSPSPCESPEAVGCCAPQVSTRSRPAKDREMVQFVLGSMARQCQGLAPQWLLLSAALPPGAAVHWSFEWRLVGWVSLPGYRPLWGESPAPIRPPRFFAPIPALEMDCSATAVA